MDRQYLELFKQLIRLKTTHDPENMSEHDRCRDLLKAEAEKHGLKTRLIPSDPYPSLLAGLDVETLTRMVFHAGSPAVPESPNEARCILALSRSHYTSKDPARKIKNDAAGRGWFSNTGAILAVKAELGMTDKRDAGLGMAPVCWLD